MPLGRDRWALGILPCWMQSPHYSASSAREYSSPTPSTAIGRASHPRPTRRSRCRIAVRPAKPRDHDSVGNQTMNSGLSFRSGNAAAIRSRRYSIRKARPPHSSRAPHRGHGPGTTSMSVSRSRESITRRHTTSMALALIWLRSASRADAPKLPSGIRSQTRIASLGRRHGGKITAASPIVSG